MKRRNKTGQLDFKVTSFGKWWGYDLSRKGGNDIDVVAANKFTKQISLCECKWRTQTPDPAGFDKLLAKRTLFLDYEEYHYLFVCRAQVDKRFEEMCAKKDIKCISLGDFYF